MNIRKKKHKIMSLMLVAVLVLTSFGVSGKRVEAAVYNGSCGTSATWSVDTEAGTLTISGTGIISDYSNSGVVAPWYTHRASITSIAINEGITKIGTYNFQMLTKIEEITIAGTVKDIPAQTFQNYSVLKNINFSEGLVSISTFAFSGCIALKSVTIPQSVTTIGTYAFDSCSSLEIFNISEGLVSVEGSMLNNTPYYTNNLTSDGLLIIDYLLVNGKNAKGVVNVPEGIEVIANYSFPDNKNITAVTLPSTIKILGTQAFYRSSITELYVKGVPTIIGADSFNKCASLESVVIDGDKDNITTVAAHAFSYCTALKSVIFNGAMNAPSFIFEGDTVLQYVKFGENFTGSVIFNGLKSVKVVFGDGVNKLPSMLFYSISNTAVSEVVVEGEILEIGSNAFYGATWLKSTAGLTDNATIIGQGAFNGCTAITSAILSDKLVTLGSTVFAGCTKLTNIYFYGKDTTIGTAAIPTGAIVHGLNSSTAKAYANANSLVFELIEPASPSVPIQTLVFDKYNSNNVTVAVNLGVSDLKATEVTQVQVDDITIAKASWNLSGNKVIINKSVFNSMIKESQHFITITFDDFSNTSLKNAKVIINDTTPKVSPSVSTELHNFDRYNQTDLNWTIDYGTESDSVNLYTDDTLVEASNYYVTGDKLTLKKEFLVTLSNGIYSLDFKFNDEDNTVESDILIVTGESTLSSVENKVDLFDKNEPEDVSWDFEYGTGETLATDLTVKVDGTLLNSSDYTKGLNLITIKKEYLQTLEVGAQSIDFIFNDTDNTTFTRVLNVVDSTPFIPPAVAVGSKSYNKTTPSTVDWNFSYGNSATSFSLALNEVTVSPSNYNVVGSKVTLKDSYLVSLANSDYTVKFIFNDVLNTTVTDSLTIGGEVPSNPTVEEQSVQYVKTDINYTVGYGIPAISITGIKVNGSPLPASYYTITDNTLIIKDNYLSVLNNGMYAIDLIYNNGFVVSDKLSFLVPKDTSIITTATSLLNIIYLNGSTNDLKVPLGQSVSSVSEIYCDSSLVPISEYSFVSGILTLKSGYLNSLGLGTHSIILTMNYESGLIIAQSITADFGVMGASMMDSGIILSSISVGTSGLIYEVDEAGNGSIVGYDGDEKDVVIPSEIDGTPITSVGSLKDSEGNNNVDKVTIPDTITEIKDGAIGSETQIEAPIGSAAEDYANNNGNNFTDTSNSPTIPSQEIEYNVDNKNSIVINGISLGKSTGISYIIINNYKIFEDGTILDLSDSLKLMSLDLESEEDDVASGSAIMMLSLLEAEPSFSLGEDGKLTISGELLATLGLTASTSYNLGIQFDDGTLISDKVKLKVVNNETSGGETTNPGTGSGEGSETPGTGEGGSDAGSGSGSGDSGSGSGSGAGIGSTTETVSNPVEEVGVETPVEVTTTKETTVTLPDGLIGDLITDLKDVKDIYINITIGDTIINNYYITINGKELDKSEYSYKDGVLIINKDALKGLSEGQNTISIIGYGSTGNKIVAQDIYSMIVASSSSSSNSVVKEVLTISKGSSININLLNKKKGSKFAYVSSNRDVVTVDVKSGILVAKSKGEATITVISLAGKTEVAYKINLQVTELEGNKNVLDTTRTVKLGNKIRLNSTLDKVKFSTPSKLLTVNKTGLVTPKRIGVSKIKVLESKGNLQFSYKVKVITK